MILNIFNKGGKKPPFFMVLQARVAQAFLSRRAAGSSLRFCDDFWVQICYTFSKNTD
jgi:hypothetical protein